MRPEFRDGDEGCSGGGPDTGWMMRIIVAGVVGGAVALVAATLLSAFGMLAG